MVKNHKWMASADSIHSDFRLSVDRLEQTKTVIIWSLGFGGGDPEIATFATFARSCFEGQVWTSTSSSSLEGLVGDLAPRWFFGKFARNPRGDSTSKVPRFTEVRGIILWYSWLKDLNQNPGQFLVAGKFLQWMVVTIGIFRPVSKLCFVTFLALSRLWTFELLRCRILQTWDSWLKWVYNLINAKMDEEVVSPATETKTMFVCGMTAGFKVSVRCEDVGWIIFTLPKTNVAPLKRCWFSNRNLLFQRSIFRGWYACISDQAMIWRPTWD